MSPHFAKPISDYLSLIFAESWRFHRHRKPTFSYTAALGACQTPESFMGSKNQILTLFYQKHKKGQ